MQLLIGILAVLGAIGLWLWRRRAPAQTPRRAPAASARSRAAQRGRTAETQGARPAADAIKDPRLAASGMMAAMARMDGDMTVNQVNALRVECRAAFRVEQREADEIAAYGRWLAVQWQEPEELIHRLVRIVRERAKREAHEDMISMLTRIASVEGGAPSERQALVIDRVRRGLELV